MTPSVIHTTYPLTHPFPHLHPPTPTYTHIHTHIHTYTYTHTYTHIHTHIHIGSTPHQLVPQDWDPQLAVWQGGAALAELSTFRGMWISKGEYEERGSGAMDSRFF